MSNSDYKIKYVAPSLKNALALNSDSYIPIELNSKKGLTESDDNVFVINALEESNIERNKTKKYRIHGKLQILTDNTLQDVYSYTPVPNSAWTPVTEGVGLDKHFKPRNWILNITYPATNNDDITLSKKGLNNAGTQGDDFITKAYEGFQIIELLPNNFKAGITNVLIKTAQKHGITSINDYVYISPKNNFQNEGVDTKNYLGLHKVLDFEPGNEDYGLILDTEYIQPNGQGISLNPFNGNTIPVPFLGVGKRVFEPSYDDTSFSNPQNVTQIEICNFTGGTQGPLIYTKIFSPEHGLRANDFIEVRTDGLDVPGGTTFTETTLNMPNIYKIVETPTPDTIVIKYEFPTINNTTSTGPFNFILNYKFMDGVTSEYYFRVNKILSGAKDYEVYKAAYSKNIFNDSYIDDVFLFHFDKDIDVEGLVDNLGRPLSQLYLTVVKRAGNGCRGEAVEPTQYGYCNGEAYDGFGNMTTNFQILDTNKNFYGITSQQDSAVLSTLSFYENNDATKPGSFRNTNGVYINDFVEYNRAFLTERVLSETLGKFGPVQAISVPTNLDPNVVIYNSADAYTNKIHYEIPIRKFSETIETVNNLDNEIYPDYSQINNDGTVSWRDLLDIGFFEPTENGRNGVDYPFVNAKHYLFGDYPIYIRRTLEVDTIQTVVNENKFVKFNTNNTPNDEC